MGSVNAVDRKAVPTSQAARPARTLRFRADGIEYGRDMSTWKRLKWKRASLTLSACWQHVGQKFFWSSC